MSWVSNCCGCSPLWEETDICGCCREHADFYDDEEDDFELD